MPSRRGAIGVMAGIAAVALAARRVIDVVEVRGSSMAPSLLPGDRLIAVRRPPRVGDVALAADPRDPRRELVKRVTRVDATGITLRGDDPDRSTDGRTFGALPPSVVRWRVVGRYWPPARIGRIAPPGPHARLTASEEGGQSACASPEALIAG